MFELLSFLRLFHFMKKRLFLGVLLGLLTLLAGIGLLALSGWFISAAAYAGMTAGLALWFNYFLPSAGVRFFAMLRIAARYGERVVNHDMTFHLLTRMRVWCYQLLDPIAPAFLARRRYVDFLNRMVTDINAMDGLYLRIILPFLLACIVSIVLWVFLQFYSVLIADQMVIILWIAIIVLPCVAVYLGNQKSMHLIALMRLLHVQAIDNLQGLAELLIFSADTRQVNAFMLTQEQLIRVQQKMAIIKGIFHASVVLFSGGSVCLALYVGGDLVNTGQLGGANLALIALAVLAAYEAIVPLPVAFQYLGQVLSSARRLNELKQHAPEILFPEKSKTLPLDNSIIFAGVSFSYHVEQPVLFNFDLAIQPGEHVAILGQTGSGKSSIVKLLTRFILPDSGSIRVGGVPLISLSREDLRNTMSVLAQKPHIFSQTVRENLCLACPDILEVDLWRALSYVDMAEFVRSLPEGLDTWLGEFGAGLSGGQLHRLALARIFLHDAPIWVLDEPTEGLDNVTEQRVISKILEKAEGKTLLWVTHKPGVLISRMDRVIRIDTQF